MSTNLTRLFTLGGALGLGLLPQVRAQFTLVETGGTFSSTFTNVAAATNGALPFGSSEYGTPHFITNINDGLYGNDHSWLGAAVPVLANSYSAVTAAVGVVFAAPATITSFAFGRDNTGAFTDRNAGTYEIAYSTDPVAGFNFATASWQTLGTLNYFENAPAQPSFRQLYELVAGPLAGVTAFRIITQVDGAYNDGFSSNSFSGPAIDELEIYSTTPIPEPATAGALAGLGALGLVALRRRARR